MELQEKLMLPCQMVFYSSFAFLKKKIPMSKVKVTDEIIFLFLIG